MALTTRAIQNGILGLANNLKDAMLTSAEFKERLAGALPDYVLPTIIKVFYVDGDVGQPIGNRNLFNTIYVWAIKLTYQKFLGDKSQAKRMPLYDNGGAFIEYYDFTTAVHKGTPLSYSIIQRFSLFVVGFAAVRAQITVQEQLPKEEVITTAERQDLANRDIPIYWACLNGIEHVIPVDQQANVDAVLAIGIRFAIRQISKKDAYHRAEGLIGIDKIQKVLTARGAKYDMTAIIAKQIADGALKGTTQLTPDDIMALISEKPKEYGFSQKVADELISGIGIGETMADRKQRIENRRLEAAGQETKLLPKEELFLQNLSLASVIDEDVLAAEVAQPPVPAAKKAAPGAPKKRSNLKG